MEPSMSYPSSRSSPAPSDVDRGLCVRDSGLSNQELSRGFPAFFIPRLFFLPPLWDLWFSLSVVRSLLVPVLRVRVSIPFSREGFFSFRDDPRLSVDNPFKLGSPPCLPTPPFAEVEPVSRRLFLTASPSSDGWHWFASSVSPFGTFDGQGHRLVLSPFFLYEGFLCLNTGLT